MNSLGPDGGIGRASISAFDGATGRSIGIRAARSLGPLASALRLRAGSAFSSTGGVSTFAAVFEDAVFCAVVLGAVAFVAAILGAVMLVAAICAAVMDSTAGLSGTNSPAGVPPEECGAAAFATAAFSAGAFFAAAFFEGAAFFFAAAFFVAGFLATAFFAAAFFLAGAFFFAAAFFLAGAFFLATAFFFEAAFLAAVFFFADAFALDALAFAAVFRGAFAAVFFAATFAPAMTIVVLVFGLHSRVNACQRRIGPCLVGSMDEPLFDSRRDARSPPMKTRTVLLRWRFDGPGLALLGQLGTDAPVVPDRDGPRGGVWRRSRESNP